ncbi:MAG TPA: hypothetical protein VF641_05155 [Methylobacterium sp.]|jgi:hypothetical protein
MTSRLAVGAFAVILSATGALAQSYNAPAGIPAAAAPGGLEGRAAVPNRIDAQGGRTLAPRDYDDRELATGSIRPRRDGPNAYAR